MTCPTCGSEKVSFNAKRRTWKCSTHHAKREFSIKVGTVMEDSPISLDKWLPAIWLLTNCKNGVSSYEVGRALKVTQKTAWFMLQRCRLAMQDELNGGSLSGEVEVDETFIRGKGCSMHKERTVRRQKEGHNTGGKAVVMGMLERGGKVQASVIPDRSKASMQPIIRDSIEARHSGFLGRMGRCVAHG